MSIIRHAKIEDLPEIQKLNQELFDFEAQYISSYNREWSYSKQGEKYFKQRLGIETPVNSKLLPFFFVATIDNQIIGYLIGSMGFYPFRTINPIAEVENMYVKQDQRRKGVGSALVEAFKKATKTRGVKLFRVESLENNAVAMDFYRKMGFIERSIFLEVEA